MEWHDRAIVLAARRHGEGGAVASLLTRDHGRHAGLVRGGAGRRLRPVLQPGNLVAVRWRARLAEQLGSFTLEQEAAAPALFLDDGDRLACLASAAAIAERALPERHPYPALFDGFMALIDALAKGAASWPAVYVRWELGVLEAVGFGLDLDACALTGARTGLAYVSPRSGRAVSATAAAAWRERLLPLPAFLTGGERVGADDIRDGLLLAGHFMARHLFAGTDLPAARERLAARLARWAAGRDPGRPDSPERKI